MHQTGRPRQGPVNPARRSGGPASVGGRRRAQWSLSGEPSNEGSVSRQSDGPKKQQQRGRRDRGEAKHERNSSIPSRSTSRFLCPISRRIISTLAPVFSLIQLETRPLRVTEPPGENKRPRSRNLRSTAGLPPRGRDRFLQAGDSLTRTRVDSGVVAQAAFGVRHLCRGDVAFPHVVELEDPGLAHAGPVAVRPFTDRSARPDSAASRTGSACARYTSDGELSVPFALSLLCSVLRSTRETFVRGVLLTGMAAMPEKRKRAQVLSVSHRRLLEQARKHDLKKFQM
ncbi:hypothetical protein B296_00000472 [Ensete ventricosum]|uniref:Uncharacterized protein n=1 Tax=Ensete ventricosum TaxID=4639 RepID=A0A427A2F5_ENSVE|nr:hypothetical protein B296_00000472 [Ensete ventricosum]